MALARTITVMDVYDRAKTGEKVEEKDWDFKIVPKTASMLKKKYGIKMNKKQIIPTDRELCSNLFKAGLELLTTCGVYCIDTKRVIKYTEEEILASLEAAPKMAVPSPAVVMMTSVRRLFRAALPVRHAPRSISWASISLTLRSLS